MCRPCLTLYVATRRANVPTLYRLLPFHDDVESIRYSIGLHAAAILSGGLALAALVKTAWAVLGAVSRDSFYRCVSYTSVGGLKSGLGSRVA